MVFMLLVQFIMPPPIKDVHIPKGSILYEMLFRSVISGA
jgi:hypothetical protein